MTESRHLSVSIDRPLAEVYAFASDPQNLPRWAPGLGSAIERDGDGWFVETSQGRVGLTFAPQNEYGVLDHVVRTPTGETVYVPCGRSPTATAARWSSRCAARRACRTPSSNGTRLW